jgi:two-component system, chemotaxis family, chemotaxis protein CheY
MRALVLDDSKTMRMILRRILSEIGFEVIEAGNGREGLNQLRKMDAPDLVTVDWDMPEMDGISFIRAVREQPGFRSTPVVMITANNDLEQVSTALDAGANEYIMKPFLEETVREKLQLLGISGL